MWKSEDNCTFFECVRKAAAVHVSSYKKSCPPVAPNCPRHKVMVRDCCSYCEQNESTDQLDGTDGTLYI